jgi:hypothetical protein
LVTNTSGNVLRRYDYLPYGEEIPRGVNGRSSKYPAASGSADEQSIKFTGKERDAETGLDYYHQTLKQSPEALRYLQHRCLEHPEMIDHFRLGLFQPDAGLSLAGQESHIIIPARLFS